VKVIFNKKIIKNYNEILINAGQLEVEVY